MPDLSRGEYLLEAMQVLGPIRHGDMGGMRVVDWPEIVAFAQGTQRISEPWEIEQVHDMALAYLAGYRTGCKLFGIEPMEQEEEGDQ
ncbi:hypothetical protein [Roseovarius sp. MMSF_3281]|uniref:hypothetical protein n=1 Tax=Roseovarius sp. MMSF_3281 TaxID=3046694 RepID=UPI00273EBF68|nr:hypothetical protein [Roseovarius sp. MMSF_3281]